MTADKARALTEKAHNRQKLVDPFLNHIFERIERRAALGFSSLFHPFDGLDVQPSPEVKAAVFNRLRLLGYQVRHSAYNGIPCDEVCW